jgi:lipopolysaccharide transport system permease protein
MTSAAEVPVTVLTPRSDRLSSRLAELWRLRAIVYFLTWRDLKVRYKQTALGAAWAILQPLVMMLVFATVIARVSRGLTATTVPYPAFAYAGLLLWTSVANAVTNASMGVVSNAVLVTKLYVPRASLVLSPILASLADFVIGFTILAGLMAWYRIAPGAPALTAVAFVAWAVIAVTGLSLWLAALNVKYRDVRYAVPFLVQVWLFLTPVFYRASGLHGVGRIAYSLNPMVGPIEGFRWSLLGTPLTPLSALATSAAATVVLVAVGTWYFIRTERLFADVI